MIGHSGCGKTTVLNILAGLDRPSDGDVIVDGQAIGSEPRPRRDLPGPRLLPWRTVVGNVAFAVPRAGRAARRRSRRMRGSFIDLVGLNGAEDKSPARALRRHEAARRHRPRACDRAEDHADGRALLGTRRADARHVAGRGRRICRETGQTVFMITHDVDEAIYLADRIVLMTNGPGAGIAEIVENPLPKERRARHIHRASRLLRSAQPPHRFPRHPQLAASRQWRRPSDDRRAPAGGAAGVPEPRRVGGTGRRPWRVANKEAARDRSHSHPQSPSPETRR